SARSGASMSALVPYAFARSQGVVVATLAAGGAEVWLREGAHPSALAELRRELGVPLAVTRVSRAVFDARLAETYSSGGDSAAEVVADVGQEVDLEQLMVELPAVEDLLERQDDARIIRLINALL